MLFFSNSNAAVVCDFIGFKGICFNYRNEFAEAGKTEFGLGA